jgi:primosomal protein N' (replication factor Y)
MAHQPGLFDPPAPPWQGGASSLFAEVVVSRPLRTAYIYSVPEKLADQILPGKRVLVPFGKSTKPIVGYCVGVVDAPPSDRKLKPIHSILDEQALLAPSMLRLSKWISEYYFCGWGQVLDAVLPAAVKQNSGTRWQTFLIPLPAGDRSLADLTPKQRDAYEALVDFGRPSQPDEVARAARCGPAVVRTLVQKGWAAAKKSRVQTRSPDTTPSPRVQPLLLNPHQQRAFEAVVAAVRDGAARTFLLHGVTGSGKTEVYLQAIAEAVRRGREAIVLVPEISLTPQTIERFRGRFQHVAVLHSHLSDAERHWHWQRIHRGEVQVVVGARSAVFAPCRNLGLIVLDEEHEYTFKQETTPRYHAREVALQRSKLESVPVVLGSATPSLESWLAAERGEYTLLSLPDRVADLTLPRVQSVDLRQEYKSFRGLASIGPTLARAMQRCLADGGQVILLLNRRGFAPAILCPQCGQVEKCPHCDIALTFHKNRAKAVCHSCDAVAPVPRQCSGCGFQGLLFRGFGTQRLEDEVKARCPSARVARMDSDTMRSAAHYERTLAAFKAGEIDVLLGTQMIAKGLDFPNVRLVGVISADTARNLPDFRGSEKTFQLIVQVSGRAGRGADPGLVLVQTFNPDDPVIQSAVHGDFFSFVQRELPTRRDFRYPPFTKLTRIVVRSKEEAAARAAAETIAESLRARAAPGSTVLGPAPAPFAKLRDLYRFHVQVQSPDDDSRRALLDAALAPLSLPPNVESAVDVDPIELL